MPRPRSTSRRTVSAVSSRAKRQTGWAKTPEAEPIAPKSAHEFTDSSRGLRLQKVMAEAGVGSRRHCEQLIESGVVRVNGHLVNALPAWVHPIRDHITVDGRHIKSHEPHLYIMLFKPRGVVTTNSDPEGRVCAVDLVKHPSKARLYPVGRLDMESSGLLLLTNDGELANRLTHPRHEVHKLYEISVAGTLEDHDVKKLESNLSLNERRPTTRAKPGSTPPKSAMTILKRDRDKTRLLMELNESGNQEIRPLMAKLGHKIRKLRRVQLGPVKLTGLQPGQWRELTQGELKDLRRASGLKSTG